jgi:hypothetical protein
MSKLPSNSSQKRRVLARLAQEANLETPLVEQLRGLTATKVQDLSLIAEDSPLGLVLSNRWTQLAIAVISVCSLTQLQQVVNLVSKICKIVRPHTDGSNMITLPPTPQAGKIGENKQDQYFSFDSKMGILSCILICIGDRSIIDIGDCDHSEFNTRLNGEFVGCLGHDEDVLRGWGKFGRYGKQIAFFLALKKLVQTFWSKYSSPIGASYATKFIAKTLSAGALSSSQQRQVFVDLPLVKSKPVVNHTHGTSASDRNAGTATCALAAVSLGLEPYYIQ